MGYDPHAVEEDVKQYWAEHDIIRKVRESTAGNEPFFMIDGPPYSNGAPHVGHMQGKVLKDVMMRFKQMNGFDVWDQAGFDTHGLPNELATEEALGIESKNEIGEEITVSEFIEECRRQATSALDLWSGVMHDLAVWQDFENPYMTYDKEYIESEWWLIKQAYEQDLLFQALKPVHWCPRCQTSLSGYEVTDEYSEVEDTAVYVALPLENRDESLVIWTTTPWTIPANMAVFVHPDFSYARVEVNDQVFIIAEQLVDTVMNTAGYEQDEYTVLNTFPGVELQGKSYQHPLTEQVPKQDELHQEHGVHQVYTSDTLVTLEEGTGLVHAATGHGQEDYEETRRFDLPVFSPVDAEGTYTDEVEAYSGAYVHDINDTIINDLDSEGVLLHKEAYTHEYPLCWRCKTKLVYRAVQQWFIENTEVKNRMLEENQDVNWIPDNIRTRFKNFVEKSPDWCISRQNYWGVPLPIWRCEHCGDRTVIGSFNELAEYTDGLPEDFDPHKHVVDELTWSCKNCETGEKQRFPDILDVWFDSGCAPFASLHYPFEEEPFESLWPMNFITEASDQIRGWFYSLLFCGILGFDEAPYETILYQGHVLDEDGKKMSKSLGNVVDPEEQVDQYGADLTRFYSLRVAPAWEQTKYNETEIKEEIYRLFSVYWNTHDFLTLYCEDVEEPEKNALQVEDRWLLSRLHSLVKDAHALMEDCTFHTVTRRIEDFILNDVSRWYVKKTRPRIKNGDAAAAWTLHHVLTRVNLLLAPFSPYITENVYQALDGEQPSVHMEQYPEPDEEWIDRDLEEAMDAARSIVEEALRIRQEEEYNLRWPAKKLVVSTDDETAYHVQELVPVIKDMANVKTVEFGEVAADLIAEPHYAAIGPKHGGDADTVARLIEELNHEQIQQVQDTGSIVVNGYEITDEDFTVEQRTADHIGSKSFDKGEVHLDLHMDDALKQEAFIAELIRNIQQARKDAGLTVDQEIHLTITGAEDVIEQHRDMVENRLVLTSLETGAADGEYTGHISFKEYAADFAFTPRQ